MQITFTELNFNNLFITLMEKLSGRVISSKTNLPFGRQNTGATLYFIMTYDIEELFNKNRNNDQSNFQKKAMARPP